MSEKLGIGPKIREFRENRGLNRAEFAAVMGVKPSKIQDIESQRQQTSDAFIAALIENYQVSLDWLFSVAGDQSGLRVGLPDKGNPSSGDVRLNEQDYSHIRRFQVKASAGGGLIPDPDHQEGSMAFPTSWINANGINSQLAGMIEVTGDSMAPTIPDGAMALVHLPEMVVLQEGIYAFTREGAVYIKRIVPSNFGQDGRPQVLSLVSDNPSYKVEVVVGQDLNNLRIAGRVRCAIVLFD